MNRPDGLIKELRDFDACEYGDELSSRQCHEIVDYIDKLEKALDNACELLEEYSTYDDPTPKGEWKEQLLND